MNIGKGHLSGRGRVEYKFGALVDRTVRERRREERRLAERRATKHQFDARNSCNNKRSGVVLDFRRPDVLAGGLLSLCPGGVCWNFRNSLVTASWQACCSR